MHGYFAVDIGGTKVELGVGDEAGRLLATARLETAALGDGEAAVERMARALRELRRTAAPEVEPLAVGIGSPGPLDLERGELGRLANLRGWDGLPIVRLFRTALGLPVYLANDATAAALAEWRWGAGAGTTDMVYVTVSTGVGAGIVSGGRLVEGRDGNAGEIGHVVVDPDGHPCHCGNRGCLETVASGTAIAREAERRRRESPLLTAYAGPLDAARVFEAAQAGDPVAGAVVRRAAETLGWAVGLFANLYNPERVVFGGGVAQQGEALLGPVRRAARRFGMPALVGRLQVVRAALGPETGVRGALAVAMAGPRRAAPDTGPAPGRPS
ncbi:MAG: ROK family protein [Actinomycetia bacterium]|nr:ROK family protein [Actinomycetes bacterium]